MICRSCQQQRTCLPAQLAVGDAALQTMLKRLRTCDRYRSTSPLERVRAWMTGLRLRLGGLLQ